MPGERQCGDVNHASMYARRLRGGCGLVGMAAAGCVFVVTPPETSEPVTVLLADYGRHASLLLPRPAGPGLVEFAYGEWVWFAEGRREWYRVPGVLFLPGRGALGRREWPAFSSVEEARWAMGLERAIAVPVDRGLAAALLERLETRYAGAAATALVNPESGLTFVHDPSPYGLLHNCNGQVAEWLRELGAGVSGWTIDAAFEVRAPRGSGPGGRRVDAPGASPRRRSRGRAWRARRACASIRRGCASGSGRMPA